ncbi:hypothetical protein EON77_15320 [bacterium]|nr:MAG: hypothetical protein EON77_15320 [bacterium]
MTLALGLVEAEAPREDDVGPVQKRGLQGEEPRIGELEVREFVHAVVDDRRRRDVAGEGEHHGRVEPEYRRRREAGLDQQGEQIAQPRLPLRLAPPVRQARTDRDHAVVGERVIFEIGQRMIAGDVFFEEEDPPAGREAAHEMLRPLDHEVPTQVGEADDRWLRTAEPDGVALMCAWGRVRCGGWLRQVDLRSAARERLWRSNYRCDPSRRP